MLFGFLVAKWSGISLAKGKCMAFEVGMQNSGLGVALASVHFAANPMTALPAIAAFDNATGPMLATASRTGVTTTKKASFFDRMKRPQDARQAGAPLSNKARIHHFPKAATISVFPVAAFVHPPKTPGLARHPTGC